MAVAMCLLEIDVTRAFTDAGMHVIQVCLNIVIVFWKYLKEHVCKSLVTSIFV